MQAERRTITRIRLEWVLPSPCSVEEVGKATSSAAHAWEAIQLGRRWSDLTVEARDDEIVIWWEETSPVTPTSGGDT